MSAKGPKHSAKLIVALDIKKQNQALALVDKLTPTNCILKVGSEMFTLFGSQFVQLLVSKGFKVFLDLKFHDIPNTVAQACVAAAELGVWMINVHALGGSAMMVAASQALIRYGKDRPLLIAVTILTSSTQQVLTEIGIELPIEEQVIRLALLAKNAGLDGVVCGALEVPEIKAVCGKQFLTVTPGIRLAGNALDDQARIVSVEQAVSLGSDYLVVGRPITQAEDPPLVIHEILHGIQFHAKQ